MFKSFMLTRGSGLFILLLSLYLYNSSKNYREVLLYGEPGFLLLEIIFLTAFYLFFKQLQQHNWQAKLYALLPLFIYYAIYEYNLLQFGSVLKFQDFLLIPEFLDVLPVINLIGIIFIACLPVFFILANVKRKWQFRHFVYPLFFLSSIFILSMVNPVSKLVYERLSMQSFSHEHVVAMYGPLSAAFMFENKRKIQLEEIERYLNSNNSAEREPRYTLPSRLLAKQPSLHKADSDKADLDEEASYKNIHLIILESFIDVRKFKKIRFDSDYLNIFVDPIFESNTQSLAPGFGNGTARTEFEILCGLPSLQLLGAIEFNVFSGQQVVDCLPEILNGLGYLTIASHAYKPNYYNRIKAYKTLGFADVIFGDKYSRSNAGLKVDDAPGGWLHDESLYRQNIAMIKKQLVKKRPVFNYVLTTYGHYPFTRNEDVRPEKIHIYDVSDETNRLLNQIYYRVEALKRYLNELKSIDPEALVVVVSDHLPPLTLGASAYKKLEYAGPYRGTLALVNNGRDYLALPEIRHYDLFQIILNNLSEGAFCKQNRCFYLENNLTGKLLNHKVVNQKLVNQQYIQLMKQSVSH